MTEYKNINGRSRATAEALLVAATTVGADVHEVRTTIRGYIVPEKVAAEYERMLIGESDPVADDTIGDESEDGPGPADGGAPEKSWKNDEIKAWAEAHEVDLGGATKKADMLAAIQAADTEEG